VATGICHADLAVAATASTPTPIVLGHEGAGIVQAVGSGVDSIVPGDRAILSFDDCGSCTLCLSGRPSYRRHARDLNFGGSRLDGSSALLRGGKPARRGHFFGQSSFATYAVAQKRNAVKVQVALPLELLGPLGCGIQTGAGAVLNSLRAGAGSKIVIFGVGSVGLSAVLAASAAGCTRIIAVDKRRSP
jgi:aryl-alcohol dehydrogenase